MKKLVPLFILLIAPLFSKAQTYQYIPMDLDTSSFWVLEYSWGGAGSFQGERVCAVVGDTIISGDRYSKVHCYTSNGLYFSSIHSFGLKTEQDYLVNEDTSLRRVYINGGIGLIDYSLALGDTLNVYGVNDPFNLPIDSIKFEQYQGSIIRRSQYSSHLFSTPFKTIEGVGTSHSFPESAFGEWGIPIVKCKCYSKGGVVQYLNGMTVDSCYRKKRQIPIPSGIIDLNSSLYNVSFAHKRLRIYNVKTRELNIILRSATGDIVFRTKIRNDWSSDLSYPTGIYILSIQSSKGIENRKIFIR